MSDEKVYFKQNVQVEPLFNQWYAWSFLIAPETAAMYVANSHLKLMQSFVAAPQVHISALKNPAMLGGPFINCEANRVNEIQELANNIKSEHGHMLEFAEAVKALDKLLSQEAKGYSLEPLYPMIPDLLKGYVELVYDLNNTPSFRFVEGLLYRSRFYNPASQSLTLSLVKDDERPFAFSTPRLKEEGRLHLSIPFADEALDQLFQMKTKPRPYNQIRERLNISSEQDQLFRSFFTEEPPPTPTAPDAAMRVRYLGHACVLVSTKEASILIDPVISYSCSNGLPRYTFEDLPETIDFVLITHNHQDHCMFETLLQLRHKVKQVLVPKNSGGSLVDPSLKLILKNIGFKNVIEIDEMETISFDGGKITGIPFLGEHADFNIRSKLAYWLSVSGKNMLWVADSNNLEPRLYERIRETLGSLDLLFIGMECDGAPFSWLYGPLLTRPLARTIDQSRRLNGSDYEKGLSIVDSLQPKHVYVYAMGQEPWLTYLTSIKYTEQSRPIIESNKLVAHCRERGIEAERLYGCKELVLA